MRGAVATRPCVAAVVGLWDHVHAWRAWRHGRAAGVGGCVGDSPWQAQRRDSMHALQPQLRPAVGPALRRTLHRFSCAAWDAAPFTAGWTARAGTAVAGSAHAMNPGTDLDFCLCVISLHLGAVAPISPA